MFPFTKPIRCFGCCLLFGQLHHKKTEMKKVILCATNCHRRTQPYRCYRQTYNENCSFMSTSLDRETLNWVELRCYLTMFVRIERAENAQHAQHFESKRLLTLALHENDYCHVSKSKRRRRSYLDEREQDVEKTWIAHKRLDDESSILCDLTECTQCDLSNTKFRTRKTRNKQKQYLSFNCRRLILQRIDNQRQQLNNKNKHKNETTQTQFF